MNGFKWLQTEKSSFDRPKRCLYNTTAGTKEANEHEKTFKFIASISI